MFVLFLIVKLELFENHIFWLGWSLGTTYKFHVLCVGEAEIILEHGCIVVVLVLQCYLASDFDWSVKFLLWLIHFQSLQEWLMAWT